MAAMCVTHNLRVHCADVGMTRATGCPSSLGKSAIHCGIYGRGGCPSALADAWMYCRSRGSLGYGGRSSRLGVVMAGTHLLTASRISQGSDFVRVMGPGIANANGIGRLLVFDEFFQFPSRDGIILPSSDTLLESLIYHCDEEPDSQLETLQQVKQFQPRHGIQLYLKSNMVSLKQGPSTHATFAANNGSSILEKECIPEDASNFGSLVLPMISHVREASMVSSVSLEGGATVRVVGGKFSKICAPPPFDDFVLLDVVMRPGSSSHFPLELDFGFLIYILEGVGIFEPNRFEVDATPFYQNEGHGLYIPPSMKEGALTGDSLSVRTHNWSHLRFILAGAPLS